jgi:hypothetical protein
LRTGEDLLPLFGGYVLSPDSAYAQPALQYAKELDLSV